MLLSLVLRSTKFNIVIVFQECTHSPVIASTVLSQIRPSVFHLLERNLSIIGTIDMSEVDIKKLRGDYAEFSKKWIAVLPRIMKPTSTAWIFSGWTNLIDILNAARDAKLLLINHIIWRYQFGVFTQRKFVTSHYHVLFFSKTENYYFNKINHYPLDVWDINRTYRKGEVKNGTKLPEELIQRCIDFSTRPGDVVPDPFMGNGTTAVVAKANFRHYVGFELNKSMREVIGANVSSIQVGQGYIPYSEREDEMVERARRKYYSRNRSDV